MEITRLKHTYGKDFTLDVKNLKIDNHEIIGLVGENGAGKTTLMSILGGHLKANKISAMELEEGKRVLFIPSELYLYEFLTVEEFLRLFVKYSKCNKKIEELLEILEIEDKRDKAIEELSLGMKKKITLLPMLVNEYDLIILDEPFNSIDINYIYNLKKIIREKSKRCTFLISSHIIDTLNDLCSKVVVMKNGSVVNVIETDKQTGKLEEQIIEKYINV